MGKDVVLLRNISAQNPRVEEEIVLNLSYDSTFPYGKGGKDMAGKLRSLGISLYFVQDGMFIECAMYFEKKKDESKEDFIKRAQTLCLNWQKTVKAHQKLK